MFPGDFTVSKVAASGVGGVEDGKEIRMAGEVGAVDIGVEGGGVLRAESAAELPEVMDSGIESAV